MARVRKNEISLNFSAKCLRKQYSLLSFKLNPVQMQVFKREIKEMRKSLKEHFKNDKWDIDARIIIDEIYNSVLGTDLSCTIMLELSKLGKLVYKDNNLFLSYKGKK